MLLNNYFYINYMYRMTSEEIHAIGDLCNNLCTWFKKCYIYYTSKECVCDCCLNARVKKD